MNEFFEVIKKRRSIRRFKAQPFPAENVQKALEMAVLAPNSSNVQCWNFYWVKSDSKLKRQIINACLNQSAARTADQLVVITADGGLWRRSQAGLIDWVKRSQAPKGVLSYYEKLIPFTYSPGVFNVFAPVKFLFSYLYGLFKPIVRGPFTKRDIQEVVIKSAALAAENFVLSITAMGGATCMMEGFDEKRMKKILKLPHTTRIVMAIAIGYPDENGTWGSQYRIPNEMVIHEVD